MMSLLPYIDEQDESPRCLFVAYGANHLPRRDTDKTKSFVILRAARSAEGRKGMRIIVRENKSDFVSFISFLRKWRYGVFILCKVVLRVHASQTERRRSEKERWLSANGSHFCERAVTQIRRNVRSPKHSCM